MNNRSFLAIVFGCVIMAALLWVAIAADDDISRLYNFTANTTIQSAQFNGEFNQLISTMNGKMSRAGVNTVSGNNTFSGTATFTNTNGVTTDTITEHTAANGVSVDSLSIKDGYAAQPGYVRGCRVVYKSASTITIKSPCSLTDSTNAAVLTLAADQDVALSTSGANGLDTGAEASSTWYNVYLIGKTDGTVAGLLSVTNEASSGTITQPTGYTLKKQLPIAIRNDGSSNIINFYVGEGWPNLPKVMYRVSMGYGSSANNQILTGASATTYTSVDASAYIPPISHEGVFLAAINAASGAAAYDALFRTPSGGQEYGMRAISSVSEYAQMVFGLETSSVQAIEYKVSNANLNANLYVAGFVVTEVNR